MSASQTIDATYALNLGDSVGEWSFSFYAAIANGQVTQWNNVVITLVPAPGTVAFFGVGGLVATRRRRA